MNNKDIDFNKLPETIKNYYKNYYKNHYDISFELKEINQNNYSVYSLKVNDNSFLENDNSSINHFKIKSIDIKPVIINEKNKHKYMFDYDYKENKFVYPENIGTDNF